MINKNNAQGFSLMELMMAVAILGIISSIAIPSYTQYVLKAKRTEAKTEVLRIAQLQESYYVQNLSYAKDAKGLGFSDVSVATETGLYDVKTLPLTSAGVADTTCDGTNVKPCAAYVIEASPASGSQQSNDSGCQAFRLSSTGLKQAKSSSDTGWTNHDTSSACW